MIDREEVVQLDKATLPADAQFKGYQTVVVQDMQIKTDNIRFHKEKYYSLREWQTCLAALPVGYEGQFGPTVRALVLAFHYAASMTEPKIVGVLGQMGVLISEGEISNLLIKKQALWQVEAVAVLQADLGSSRWQHIDDTGTRINRVNQHCHVLCNPFCRWYVTRPRKERLTVIVLLQNNEQSVYLLNEHTLTGLTTFAIPP